MLWRFAGPNGWRRSQRDVLSFAVITRALIRRRIAISIDPKDVIRIQREGRERGEESSVSTIRILTIPRAGRRPIWLTPTGCGSSM